MGGTCSKGEEDYNIKRVICKTNSSQLGSALCNKYVEQRQDEGSKKKNKSKNKKKSYIKNRRRTKRKK